MRVTVIRGRVVDVSAFAAAHPGGSHMVDLAVGRDATILFESSHLRAKLAEAALAKLPTVSPAQLEAAGIDLSEIGAESFCTPGRSEFYRVVRERVWKEVVAPRVGAGGSARGVPAWHIAAVLVSWLAAAVYFMHTPCVLSAMLLGFTMAWIGTGVQHTANHGGMCGNTSLNYLLGLTDDVITGGSSLVWRFHHQVGHHCYCNDVDKDQDVHSSFPLIRLDAAQELCWYHRYQWVYGPVLFCFLYFSIQLQDCMQLWQRRSFETKFTGASSGEIVLAFALKLLHFAWFFALPATIHGVVPMLLPWLVTIMFGSFVLAATFIVSHNLEATKPDQQAEGSGYQVMVDGKMVDAQQDWAVWQVVTSASWGSAIGSFFSGGLNLQIEHHLFPCVAHHHYAEIQKVVEDECAKRGITYTKFTTLPEIFVNLVVFLHSMGRVPEAVAPPPAVAAVKVKDTPQQRATKAAPALWMPIVLAVAYQTAQEYHSAQYPDHPSTWTEVSATKPLYMTVAYLLVIYYGRKIMATRSPPENLKQYIIAYNLYQVCLNAWCVYMFIKEVFLTCYNSGVRNPWHLRVSDTSHAVGYLIWVHYNNKFVELLDTVFMVLNKKDQQISFLHVYHHVLLVWSWFAVCRFGGAGGLSWFSACFNSFVHVLMYAYYMLAAMKVVCPWKQALTKIQMAQFVCCMSSAFYGMYHDLYPRALSWLNVWVMSNMFILFYRFYQKRYHGKAKATPTPKPAAGPEQQQQNALQLDGLSEEQQVELAMKLSVTTTAGKPIKQA